MSLFWFMYIHSSLCSLSNFKNVCIVNYKTSRLPHLVAFIVHLLQLQRDTHLMWYYFYYVMNIYFICKLYFETHFNQSCTWWETSCYIGWWDTSCYTRLSIYLRRCPTRWDSLCYTKCPIYLIGCPTWWNTSCYTRWSI